MTLNCIIVDDEPLAVKLLESFVMKTPELKLLGSFTDSVVAINIIKEQKPDILFLDIQMPDLNGVELAHMLPVKTRVIFTTAYKEYAYDSFEVYALDFLLKPIRYDKFLIAVDKAIMWFENRNKTTSPLANCKRTSQMPLPGHDVFFLRSNGEYRQVFVNKLLYVKGLKDYVMFYLENEHTPLITYLRMKNVEELLPSDRFIRVNRSYIVAFDKIEKIDSSDCIYIKDEIIHITEGYINKFRSFLHDRKILINN
jgi:DNA-binding LytR/AlgR family response regulator